MRTGVGMAEGRRYLEVADPARVGTCPARAFAGGGYVRDGVLDYRVWFPASRGDAFHAFATCEDALAASDDIDGAEPPPDRA